MTTSTLTAMLLVGGGMALVVIGFLSRVWAREERLAEILDLPWGDQDVDVAAVTQRHSELVELTVGMAGRMVDQIDAKRTLFRRLELARVPMRPGEYVVVVAGLGLVAALVASAVTASFVFGVLALIAAPFLGKTFLDRRINKRRKEFQERFPEALGLIASSLSAGHTFLRAIQIMNEEAEGPIAEEFGRVLNETQLGGSLVDALDRMATRVDIRDVDWVVQAIKIQQQVGGKLADLLHILADFIRARAEVRREIDVLTAEGRLSGWFIGLMPAFLLVMLQVINPEYMKPMFQGWGPVWLGVAGLITAASLGMINKLVNSIEV